MKVLAAIVSAPHWLVAGGPNAALRLSAALAKICDIDLARMAAADATENSGGLTIFDLGCSNPFALARRIVPRSLFMLFYKARIPDLIRTGRYDLVHIHNPLPALEMQRIARACLHAQVPYVVSTHGLVELASKGTAVGLGRLERIAWRLLVDAPFRYVLRHAASVMALSPADVPILNDIGCGSGRIDVVPNGVDVPAAPADPRGLGEVCRKFGLPFPKPVGVPVGMFLGNHTKNKGVAVLLDAFSGYHGPFRMIVAGSQRDYIDYDSYLKMAKPNQTFHFPGFVCDEEAGALLEYADLFVFPTLSDTFPLVVLEAMARGVPILATRVGGLPHQVPESCGCLVDPRDPKALIGAFERLTRDMGGLAAMGAAAKAHVAHNFSWDASAQAALSVYRAILSPPSHARGPTQHARVGTATA
ncbi:MAG: glycosyl transferase, group 1 [Deltaproteobacteria bacterium]|nr:glycosyl transferase, group 1 [Deltaproteobacteria bacterium]